MASPIVESGFGHTLFSFDRRLARGPFWLYGVAIPSAATFLLLKVSDLITGLRFGGSGALDGTVQASNVIVLLVFYVAALWVFLATGIKRLHDRDMSGWWIWIVLIPYIGWLALFILLVQAGTHGENRFGPEPPLWGEPYSGNA